MLMKLHGRDRLFHTLKVRISDLNLFDRGLVRIIHANIHIRLTIIVHILHATYLLIVTMLGLSHLIASSRMFARWLRFNLCLLYLIRLHFSNILIVCVSTRWEEILYLWCPKLRLTRKISLMLIYLLRYDILVLLLLVTLNPIALVL